MPENSTTSLKLLVRTREAQILGRKQTNWGTMDKHHSISPSEAFGRMIKYTEKLHVPRLFKNDLIKKLDFLKTQSLCDADRRAKQSEIKEAWKALEEEAKVTDLFSVLRQDHQIWPAVLSFIKIADEKYVPPQVVKISRPQAENPYESWNAIDLFHFLRGEARFKRGISEIDRQILVLGLNCLYGEAEKPKLHQDFQVIGEAWRAVKPILIKYKMLDRFEGEDNLSARLKYFIFRKM